MISWEIHSHASESCRSLQPEGGIRDANKDECNSMWWEMRIPPWIWPPVSLSSEMPSGRAEETHYCSSHVGAGGNGRMKMERERENQLPLWMNWQATTFSRHWWQIWAAAVDSVSTVEPLICPSSLALWLLLWGIRSPWWIALQRPQQSRHPRQHWTLLPLECLLLLFFFFFSSPKLNWTSAIFGQIPPGKIGKKLDVLRACLQTHFWCVDATTSMWQ